MAARLLLPIACLAVLVGCRTAPVEQKEGPKAETAPPSPPAEVTPPAQHAAEAKPLAASLPSSIVPGPKPRRAQLKKPAVAPPTEAAAPVSAPTDEAPKKVGGAVKTKPPALDDPFTPEPRPSAAARPPLDPNPYGAGAVTTKRDPAADMHPYD